MGFLGRGNDDGFNGRIIDQSAPIRGCAVEAKGFCLFLRAGLGGRANQLANRPQPGFKHRADRLHRNRVRLAHIAAADDPYSDIFHH